MHPIEQLAPDLDLLLALSTEELAGQLLFAMRTQPGWFNASHAGFHLGNFVSSLVSGVYGGQQPYGGRQRSEVSLAIREAFAWLEAQGLLVPAEGSNGQNGWRELSRRASTFEDRADFADFMSARLLPKQLLHPKIAARSWLPFMRGEYDTAVFQAMKAVEVQLAEAAPPPRGELGVGLARYAFHVENGPLTDQVAERGEREAMGALFAGALGALKNPHSHREVELEDPAQAASIIMFAGYLLSIVEARSATAAAG